QAMAKAIACLEELDIVGIKTNVDFQLEVLLSDKFVNNTYTTALVNDLLKGD
ncbi:MAG: acetyl-CoA carboxylase biotin carboxylase subunit, partial [Erysipelothrix sp.]|nr:acetyl-CoA carboxylase biotin carboxylase subunit [Erysipelothrix sp.]